jgi:hypothetical protein
MKILDVDLDFFLSEPPFFGEVDGPRLDDEWYKPWSLSEIRNFLERQCGLSNKRPLLGKFVTHHDEVFFDLRAKIDQKRITPGFEVVHVDAHADLGFDDFSWKYIMTDLLGKSLSERKYPKQTGRCGLNCGNYLAFAIACRWIGKLVYVHHPHTEGNDFMLLHMKNFDPNSGYIQMKYYGKSNDGTID